MENIQLTEKQKNIAFGIIAVITVLFSYLIFSAIENSNKHQLSIYAVPTTAHISINGVDSTENTTLPTGVYTITVSNEGFLANTQTITVDSDIETGALLQPISDDAKKWSRNNINEYPEDFDYTIDQYPVVKYLPYSNYIYSIGVDDTTISNPPLKLIIESLPGYYNAPIDKIRSMGYSPEDYIYAFNYKDPFK
jgi:hypothetical protein